MSTDIQQHPLHVSHIQGQAGKEQQLYDEKLSQETAEVSRISDKFHQAIKLRVQSNKDSMQLHCCMHMTVSILTCNSLYDGH